jgi:hypothetical protein
MSCPTDRKLRNMNIGAGLLQALLCIGILIWLFSQWGEESTFRLGVSLNTVVIMLAVFTAITCLFHTLYAIGVGKYTQNVQSGKNWMRWLEYSITASIMLWIIAVSSGVTSPGLQVLVVVMSILCMLCGLLSEQTNSAVVKRWATIIGWLFIAVGYSVVILKFADNVNSTDVSIPGFVYAIVIGMCIMYMSFGGIHLFHMYKGNGNACTNRTVEVAYTVDSMISKTLLVSLLFSGLVVRNNA